MQSKPYGHAVVIGGSIAGLLAARVLTDYFQTVTIVERDPPATRSDCRRGAPQAAHAHALLLRGQQTIWRLFPGARQALIDAGAVVTNAGRDMKRFHFGVWRCRYPSALQGISASRPLIEWTIAERVRRLPGVKTLHGWSVESLLYSGERVSGVRIRKRDERDSEDRLQADLVIDASGRGSQTPLQLRARGFDRPPETSVKIDVRYATCIYRAPDTLPDWKSLLVISQPPRKRGALLLPLENKRWIVTLMGMHGDEPPTDAAGFLRFAKSLPVPDMHEALLSAQPLTEITRYGYSAGLRRHYEKLQRFPQGLLVLGDALCSFNPVYGQGMSVASMYADVLDACLRERAQLAWGLSGLWRAFFEQAARVADRPWQLATSEDFRYSETIGPRSPALRFLHWYTNKLQSAASRMPSVAERLNEVVHLLKPPAALLAPDILWQLLTQPRAGSRGFERSEPSHVA
jgi:2-polyprenyl-6-methoxyphenol hydroxylase-like FAD-dependent oxidoreductase